MQKQEEPIGDYTSNISVSLQITSHARQQMIFLIEELHELKQYKIETLFLAVDLADRYLVYVAFSEARDPCLVTLAATCILMAAKLEEPISPSFLRMINLIAET